MTDDKCNNAACFEEGRIAGLKEALEIAQDYSGQGIAIASRIAKRIEGAK